MKHLIIVFIFILIASSSAGAGAVDVRLLTLDYSRHWDQSNDPNEKHGGVGFEIGDGDGAYYGGILYKDSHSNDNVIITKTHDDNGIWDVGMTYGAAFGYEAVDVLPFVGVTTRYRYFKLTWLPAVTYFSMVIPIE